MQSLPRVRWKGAVDGQMDGRVSANGPMLLGPYLLRYWWRDRTCVGDTDGALLVGTDGFIRIRELVQVSLELVPEG